MEDSNIHATIDSMSTQDLEELQLALERKRQALVAQQQALALNTLDFPDLTAAKTGRPTLENTHVLLQHYGIRIRYNEMTKDVDIDIPLQSFSNDTELNGKLEYLKILARKHNLNPSDLLGHVTYIANLNSYHPVRDWLDQLEWDGQDRLGDYYNTIELEEPNELKEVMMRKWAVSCVAALYHDNFGCEGVLTFSGRQAAGKTTWVERLLPAEYRNTWNKDAVIIDTKNKDSILKSLQYWITELGEIDATFKKSDIEALKGFITERNDVLRPPYERKANRYARRTVFYGTVNELEFLQDSENRRFWVLLVSRFHNTNLDIQQFWAQIREGYWNIRDKISTAADRERYNEYGWYLSPTERAALHTGQEIFKTRDPVFEILDHHIQLPTILGSQSGEWLNCTMILQRCGHRVASKRDLNSAGKWMRAHGFNPDGQRRYCVDIRIADIGQAITAGKLSKPWFGRDE
jgi:putative DNA primase/helicase